MPLPKEKKVALSNALIKAVRKHIFFSPNIDSIWPLLYQQYQKSILLGYSHYLPDNLESHTGKCGALSDMICLLVKNSPMKISDEIKFMKVTFFKTDKTDNHSLVILHDNSKFIPASGHYSFCNFCGKFLGDTDIICDPWIWKTSLAKDCLSHIEYARKFEVESYYSMIQFS
ncbi:MAG: hypothetical protein GY710_07200 [Desulfobacteraceae bacterium]|nr:hypothetical protein [Desulfobacteraceae bacterium]